MDMRKLFLLLLPFFVSCAVAQKDNNPEHYSGLITEKTTHAHMVALATEDMEGRGTGQEGGRKAADYIAKEFKKYGLKPGVNGSYFQPVELVQTAMEVKDFKVNNTSYTYGVDFFIQGQNKEITIESSEVVFVGFGIEEDKYNDYRDVDVKGKVALILLDQEPVDASGNSLVTGTKEMSDWTTNRFKKLQNLISKQPKMILGFSSTNQETLNKHGVRLTAGRVSLKNDTQELQFSDEPSTALIAPKILDAILGQEDSYKAYLAKVQQSGKPEPKEINISFASTFGLNQTDLDDPNVIGVVEGSDKKDEVVVVTAHYDHDGIAQDGTIFFGADDNASGTVGVLEVARAFAEAKKKGNGPRRTVVFIAFSAEEKGLLGSDYYVQNPIYPLEQTMVNINIDMIGRIDDIHLEGNHDYIHAIGASRNSNDLQEINESINDRYTKLEIDYTYDQEDHPMRLFQRSDQWNFAKHQIPVIFYMSGLHPHYHTTEDTVDKINFPVMVQREKLIFHTTWELANREDSIHQKDTN